jgi:REP element-mobilizing transposase RayT
VRSDVPNLRSILLVREVERRLRQACDRSEFRLVEYSLQSNHVHLLVEAAGPSALARGMKSIGARLARAVNRVFGRRGPVLDERYHARALRTPREARNAIAYALLNARKYLGRFAPGVARVDPASSGRWFGGWRTNPPRAPDPPAVAHPRTWLLAVGWRRHGLLAPDEVPRGGTAR